LSLSLLPSLRPYSLTHSLTYQVISEAKDLPHKHKLSLSMDAIVNQMNVFLRVFTSINRLFCEVRWLERNLRNSNSTVMLIVGGIIIFCVYSASTAGDGSGQTILPPGLNQVLKEWGPFAIIALVLGLFLYRRSTSGPIEGSGNLNEVMFGGDRSDSGGGSREQHAEAQSWRSQSPLHAQSVSPSSHYSTVTATAPPKYIQAQAVQYV
jgi:hypothetical protein